MRNVCLQDPAPDMSGISSPPKRGYLELKPLLIDHSLGSARLRFGHMPCNLQKS